jgi:hypothetical protein
LISQLPVSQPDKTFDRLLGYGFKYPTSFRDTHLQHIART